MRAVVVVLALLLAACGIEGKKVASFGPRIYRPVDVTKVAIAEDGSWCEYVPTLRPAISVGDYLVCEWKRDQ